MEREQLAVHRDDVFDSNQCPTDSINLTLSLSQENTHIHTRTRANMRDAIEVLNSRLFRAGFSPDGESWTEPKKTQEKKALSSFASVSLSPSLSLSVYLSLTGALSLALFLSLFLFASSLSLSLSVSLSLGSQ